jgi:thioredoxin reductase (NADPH)
MNYDLIIIWAWSAWYPAWMYASRYKIKNLLIWAQPGWALATSHKVENYPWTISDSGANIMKNFKEHAVTSWTEIVSEMVASIQKENDLFKVKTSSWKEFFSKYVILATWNNYRKLWAKWEIEFLGKWVSYCATCDWMFFKNLDVVVVWWWNTALTESLYLSEICKKVYIVHRKDTFRAEDVWISEAKKRENIEFILNEEVEEITWWMFMEKVILKSWRELKVDGIFVAIWSTPNTSLVDHFSPIKDEEWCLVVDKRQKTSVEWLYAAGDVTTNSNKFKQTIMSAAEWCLAANSVHEDLIRFWH